MSAVKKERSIERCHFPHIFFENFNSLLALEYISREKKIFTDEDGTIFKEHIPFTRQRIAVNNFKDVYEEAMQLQQLQIELRFGDRNALGYPSIQRILAHGWEN